MVLSLKRGALIVFEGCDRAGKTTQCRKLVSKLNSLNVPARYQCFPDRTTVIGGVINEYLSKKADLSDQAIHLLFSANRWEIESKMKEELNSGVNLIVDRYSFSGVAFSSAKGMDFDWCWNPEMGLPKPDAVFLLNLSPEAIAMRGNFGDERYEESSFQKKVRDVFEKMKDHSWQVINADQEEEPLHEELLDRCRKVIKDSENSPLGSF